MFLSFDENKKDALTYSQFKEYLYAIGMNFIVKEYDSMIVKHLFDNDTNKRVRFDAFFAFLENNSIHEFTPE